VGVARAAGGDVTVISLLEACGLVASLATLLIVTRVLSDVGRVRRSALITLVGLLSLGHLANVLESFGYTWADAFADQFSIMVPFMWGLFLLETGRGYLSERLAASDEQVRFFLDSVPASVAWLYGEARLLGFSHAWSRALPDSRSGKKLAETLDVALPELEQAVASCARGGEGSGERLVSETARGRDGRARHFRWCARSWTHPDRPAPGVLVLLEDVTSELEAELERETAAEELARAQRLAHVGQMAAGAAHDFNNFLQIIHGAIWELEGDARSMAVLENVRRALDSAQEMTRSMLRFGREQRSRERVDLAGLLREIRKPLSYALGRRHTLEVSLPPDVGPVTIEGRLPRLQQAVLNLAVNARDAMPNGGVIEIQLEVEAEAAVISVRDSGAGMSEAVQRQLFTPFFTTKGQSGSGLGLHVVQSVVEEQRGQISVESAPERGSTFRLRLPLAGHAPAN
jgi:two-component system, cell cycle sensor histidine kinase and response regulator CckA